MSFAGKAEIFAEAVFVTSNTSFQRIVIERVSFDGSVLTDRFKWKRKAYFSLYWLSIESLTSIQTSTLKRKE